MLHVLAPPHRANHIIVIERKSWEGRKRYAINIGIIDTIYRHYIGFSHGILYAEGYGQENREDVVRICIRSDDCGIGVVTFNSGN